MKVLMLTWEFPPFISGGLAMACYGLVKSMLKKGVQIDMLLPTSEEVCFPMRKSGDEDNLPIWILDKKQEVILLPKLSGTLVERLRAIGMTEIPESYISPGFSFESFEATVEWIWQTYHDRIEKDMNILTASMRGSENLFRKVQEFTARAMKYSQSFSCDAIHVHDWLTYPAGIMLKRLLKKPLVAHIHATEFDRAGGPGDGRVHNIEYAGLTAADKVVAVSQYTARMIIDRYCVQPQKINVVHNAHSMDIDRPKRKKLFKDPVVLFLGRVTLQKGPDYFLEVAKRVISRFPKVRFIVAGSGDMFSRILRGAAAKKLKDRFLFTGFLNRDQVEKILLASDIFMLPSVSEPFGIAPLEAMAYGAVAVISKQSGVSEVIENAYKVDFWDIDKTADIVVHLLENPEERAVLAKAGQKEVFAIEWDEAAGKLIKVYEEACFT